MSPARALVAAVILAGCGGGDGPAREGDGTVLVLAAASLSDVFGQIAEEFERSNEDLTVDLSFAGSSGLVLQIEEGAPADVVAMASPETMDRLGELVDRVTVFATNDVVVATPRDDPGSVRSVEDLERSDVLVGVCAEPVPCGRYATELFRQTRIDPSIVTEEPDVRSLATKLAERELDAGVVYATDVAASAGALRAIELPDGVRVEAIYPIAVVDETSDRSAAERFVDFVVSPSGRAILQGAGFGVSS